MRSAPCFDHRHPAVGHRLNGRRLATARQRGRVVVSLPLTEVEKADDEEDEAVDAGSMRAAAGTDGQCRLLHGQADVVGVMGGLDRSIQRPTVAVDEADSLG
ncbi:hypothetical protein ACLOJK_015100 [Asimina triloba]